MTKHVILVATLAVSLIGSGNLIAEEAMPASSDFALDLYQQLDQSSGNIFFSPLSVRVALAMTSAGAKGKTLEEMQLVLRMSGEDANQTMGEMLRELEAEPKGKDEPSKLVLRVADALWGQNQYPFDPAFVKRAREDYDAEVKSVDFGNPAAARKQINDWVEEKTNKKIVDLIPDGMPTPDTRLILTNAVYFKANWEDEFSKSATNQQPFHVTADKTIDVQMMRRTGHYGYAETDDLQAIQLDYAGGETSMLILLPKAIDGLGKVEADLSSKKLGETINNLKYSDVDLSLPRFKVEQSITMGQILKAMGMKLAFNAQQADFSGMTTAQRLYIGEVLHKAFVKVDEEGTEAAAATAVAMRALAARLPEKPIEVRVDHPFLMMIRHRKTGEILFMGRVERPGE
jgi:serpin B